MTAPRLSNEEIEQLAQKRANAKMGWFVHAAVYVCVNALIFAKSSYGWGTGRWSPEPMFGWGFGLAMHGMAVFVLGKGSSVRDRMVAKERERIQRQQQDAPGDGRP